MGVLPFACQRDPLPVPSDVVLNVIEPDTDISVEEIKVTKAKVKSIITRLGNVNILSYGCVWSTETAPTLALSSKIEIPGQPGVDTIRFLIAGLSQETKYYVRTFLILTKDTVYSEPIEFHTKSPWRLLSGGYPGGMLSEPGVFKIKDRIFVGAGFDTHTDFWHFDRESETWSAMQTIDQPGRGLNTIVSFAIGDTGYFGTGTDSNYHLTSNFWSFTEAGGWNKIKDFPDSIAAGVGFSLLGKGYVGLGFNGNTKTNAFWMYDPTTDDWNPIQGFPGGKRTGAIAFVIGDKAYVGYGDNENNVLIHDLWEFNPTLAMPWTQITSNSPKFGYAAFVFVLNDSSAYIGGGSQKLTDFWQFAPNAPGDPWIKNGTLPEGALIFATGISLGNRGMVIGGRPETNGFGLTNECWIYDPE